MRQHFFIVLLAIFSLVNTYAQTPVGHRFDVNGLPFYGYFDSFIYQPAKGVTHSHQSRSFEIGHYYDKQLNKMEGFIKFDDDKIIFKNKEGKEKTRLKPEDINSFVIGIDSFFVTSNFYCLEKFRSNPEFVQFISNYDGLTFAKNYHFPSGVSQQYGGKPSVVKTFIVRSDDSDEWDNFSETNFRRAANEYFGHIPLFNEQIEDDKFDDNDAHTLIKMGEYYQKFQSKSPVYFDEFWHEVLDKSRAAYTAYIDQIQDSIWTLSYYENEHKIYQIDYSSFYPNVKNGKYISYHQNGAERQIIEFENDMQQVVTSYNPDKEIIMQYKVVLIDSTDDNEVYEIEYEFVRGKFGSNILDSGQKTAIEIEQNNSTSPTYTNAFKGNKLLSSYRLIENDTIYQITDLDNRFNMTSLQSKFDRFMTQMPYDHALSTDAEGTILVSFLISPKGFVLDYDILNLLHPEYDRIIKSFVLNRIYTNNDEKHRFKSYKIHKKKQYYEVVIPFQFSISRYYRAPAHNNYYYDPFWHNQMWMHQNNLDHIQAPDFSNFPSHF